MKTRKFNRKWANFLLQPVLQTKMGFYSVALALCFMLSLSAVLFVQLSKLFQFILELTDAPVELQDVILGHFESLQLWLMLGISLYMVSSMVLSIWYTHRMVGPMVAFRRHFEALEQGDFIFRTTLRKGDAFHEVADALNKATESLEKRLADKGEKIS